MEKQQSKIANRLPLDILVIEDTPRHIADANRYWDEIKTKNIPSNFYMVKDRQELEIAISKRKYDGIISDIYYPDAIGDKPRIENGEYSAELSIQNEIPIVFCTDSDNHSGGASWIYDFYSNKRPKMNTFVACSHHSLNNGEKAWGSAHDVLIYKIAYNDGLNWRNFEETLKPYLHGSLHKVKCNLGI